eukprot:111585-Pleurochrysis_carterae.AAC.1
MSTHTDLARLAATAGVGRICFDQCVFGAPTPKAVVTQLIASNELLSHLSSKLSEKFCDHPPDTHNSIVGYRRHGGRRRRIPHQSGPTLSNGDERYACRFNPGVAPSCHCHTTRRRGGIGG